MVVSLGLKTPSSFYECDAAAHVDITSLQSKSRGCCRLVCWPNLQPLLRFTDAADPARFPGTTAQYSCSSTQNQGPLFVQGRGDRETNATDLRCFENSKYASSTELLKVLRCLHVLPLYCNTSGVSLHRVRVLTLSFFVRLAEASKAESMNKLGCYTLTMSNSGSVLCRLPTLTKSNQVVPCMLEFFLHIQSDADSTWAHRQCQECRDNGNVPTWHVPKQQRL